MGRGRQPIRAKILMSTGRPHHYGHLLQVYKESLQPLTLYTSFHDLINVYSRRSGADNPRGQNFDVSINLLSLQSFATRGARWLSGRVSDSGARGRGFETYRRRVVSLSKALYSPKVLVNYPGSGGSVPT